jgi:hypothetical protein
VAAYSALGLARYYLGEYVQARKDCQAGMKLAERLQAWRMMGYLNAYRAMIEAASGNIDAAFEHASTAVQLGDRYRHNEITSIGYSVLGDLYSWLDSHDLAIQTYYQHGIEASNNGFLAVNQIFRLGYSLCRTGSVEAGLQMQHQSWQMAENAGLGLILIFTQLSKVLVNLLMGQWEQAKTAGAELLDKSCQLSIRSVQIYTSLALGQAALHDEDLETAQDYFLSAASIGAQLPLPWAEIEAQKQIEKIMYLTGQSDPTLSRRIQELLDQVETGVKREPLRQIFLEYRSKVNKNQ